MLCGMSSEATEEQGVFCEAFISVSMKSSLVPLGPSLDALKTSPPSSGGGVQGQQPAISQAVSLSPLSFSFFLHPETAVCSFCVCALVLVCVLRVGRGWPYAAT